MELWQLTQPEAVAFFSMYLFPLEMGTFPRSVIFGAAGMPRCPSCMVISEGNA